MSNSEKKQSCTSFLNQVERRFIQDGWITVHGENIHCGLVRPKCSTKILEECRWDLRHTSTGIELYTDGKYKSGYEQDVSPLIYRRKNGDIEIAEEFRFLYDLYRKNVQDGYDYYGLDDCGDEVTVASQRGNRILIQVKFLKEFMALKKRHLVLFFDADVELCEKMKDGETIQTDDSVYEYCVVCPLGEGEVYGRVMGKCVLKYNRKDIKDLWDWQDEGYEEFVIGYSDDGEERTFTCDNDKLSNMFAVKEGAPQGLTPVFFRKDVLDNYYSKPDKYTVEDGYLKCNRYWSLYIDNDKTDYVIVPLVYLGHIPHKEQLHWKQYNVAPPLNEGLSSTAHKRWLEGAFCDTSDAPDLVFKRQFESFCKRCHAVLGWDLFLPLTEADKHYFTALHSLTTDKNSSDFEKQVLAITKLTIDSLNKEKFTSECGKDRFTDKDGSITCFEVWLRDKKSMEQPDMFKFMRMLQDLRSNDVAHRKSSKEKKRKGVIDYFQLNTKTNRAVLDDIFVKMTGVLQMISDTVLVEEN